LTTYDTYKEAVVDLQCLLNRNIAMQLKVDGIFSSKTKANVLAWQRKKASSMMVLLAAKLGTPRIRTFGAIDRIRWSC
jgi:peptidoglycan hydrolase-like protein with peptidoglycan-binding domain